MFRDHNARPWSLFPFLGTRELDLETELVRRVFPTGIAYFFESRAHDRDGAGRFSDHTGRHAAEVAAQHRAAARAHHDVIDPIMAGIVDQLAGGVGRFEHVIGDAFGANRESRAPSA